MGTHYNRLGEAVLTSTHNLCFGESVLTSTHNLCFGAKIRKISNFFFENFSFFTTLKISVYYTDMFSSCLMSVLVCVLSAAKFSIIVKNQA